MNKKEWVCWCDGFFIALFFVAIPAVLMATTPIYIITWLILIPAYWMVRNRVVYKKFTKALEKEGL